MTKKLYLEDPYLLSCSSEVIGQTQVNGKPGIILNQTVFYPTSGGQPHDSGTINDVAVVDVFEDENKQIVHLLEKPISAPEVEATIDWERRFDHMQQHTGQHILSQAFVKAWNADTLSFHLGEKSATIDVNRTGLTLEIISTVEQLASRIIFENRKVIGHLIGKDELKQFPVRGLPTVDENIRILEIKDYDYSPCGGTHCAKTGEIGLVKIRRHENYKGGTRIHFVCGFRAVKDYQKKAAILKQLSSAMSAAEADLFQNITKMKEDLKALTGERDHLNKRLLNYEADSLFSEGKKHTDIRLLKKIFNDRHQKEIKLLAKKIVEKSDDTVILFGIKTEGNAQLLFQRSEKLAFNMGELMGAACTVINGRGGGRRRQAQGGGSDVEKLEDALQHAEDMIFKMINSE
jgi:alanyl-tRNA synthetase